MSPLRVCRYAYKLARQRMRERTMNWKNWRHMPAGSSLQEKSASEFQSAIYFRNLSLSFSAAMEEIRSASRAKFFRQ